ncbi:MAG: hypothetical protein WC528_01600 [Patescibacteria group bacterium]
MANLYWKKNKKILAATETPFKTEDELERYLLDTRGILSEINIINRQIRSKTVSGIEIPDMIGVDSEGSIVIIENKNVPVDERIISQVLNYALWAESNPDSIKNLWLQADQEGVEPEWDNLQIRIMIVAPEIKPHLAKFISKIGYPIDLLEIKKFNISKDEFIVLNKIEPNIIDTKPVHAKRNYDYSYYSTNHNKESVKKLEKAVNSVENYVNKNKWKLEKKFNQGYVGFKYGFPLVFGIQWLGTRSFGFFFKMPKAKMKKIIVPGLEFKGYNDRWDQVEYKIISPTFDVKKLKPVFLASYNYVKGE